MYLGLIFFGKKLTRDILWVPEEDRGTIMMSLSCRQLLRLGFFRRLNWWWFMSLFSLSCKSTTEARSCISNLLTLPPLLVSCLEGRDTRTGNSQNSFIPAMQPLLRVSSSVLQLHELLHKGPMSDFLFKLTIIRFLFDSFK